MEQLDTFLSRQPPFDGLDAEELRALSLQAGERVYETGEPVLVEDGPPAAGLWVILSGSMDLLHQGEVIQILEPGETFGQASLLTGMAPTFTVRARERSACAFLGPDTARQVLGTDAGGDVRRDDNAHAPHRHRARGSRPARSRHDAGLDDHAAGRLL